MHFSVAGQEWQVASIKRGGKEGCIALNILDSLENKVSGDVANFQVALCIVNQCFSVCSRYMKEAGCS